VTIIERFHLNRSFSEHETEARESFYSIASLVLTETKMW